MSPRKRRYATIQPNQEELPLPPSAVRTPETRPQYEINFELSFELGRYRPPATRVREPDTQLDLYSTRDQKSA